MNKGETSIFLVMSLVHRCVRGADIDPRVMAVTGVKGSNARLVDGVADDGKARGR